MHTFVRCLMSGVEYNISTLNSASVSLGSLFTPTLRFPPMRRVVVLSSNVILDCTKSVGATGREYSKLWQCDQQLYYG